MKNTVVFDLDGTLSNVNHRRHLVAGKKRDYMAFHARLDEDPVNEWCAAMIVAMSAHYGICLVSARPKGVEGETRRWLQEHNIHWDELFLLRPDGDSTPDQELKRAWLKNYGKEKILFVVDDRAKVVKMWREEGLICLQCDDWEERLVKL